MNFKKMFPQLIDLLVSFALIGTHAEMALAADLDMARAKNHFKQGQKHYANGEYQKALERFEVAYSYKPFPGFLFNLGQCHMELKDYEMALKRYNQYLRESPKARNRAKVEDLIRQASLKQEESKMKAVAQVTPPKPKKQTSVIKSHSKSKAVSNKQPKEVAKSPVTKKAAPISTVIKATPVDDLPLAPLVVPTQDPLQAATIPTQGMVATVNADSESVYETWWFWSIATSVVAASISAVVLTQASPNQQIVAPSGTLGTIDRR